MVGRDTGPDPTSAIGDLGRRLDVARRRGGLTYRDLEDRTGLPRSTLHHLLHGRKRLPDYWVLVGLVTALGGNWDQDGWEQLWRRAAEGSTPSRVAAPEPAVGSPTPRQLPPALDVFTGRAAALAELDAVTGLVGDRDPGNEDTCRSVVALVGPGGIGKTTVALQWAHRHQDAYPDGQLFANLGGFGPTAEPVASASALAGFLRALGVPTDAVPLAPDERAALFRSVLADRQVLLVLDNARDSEQVLPLLPGTSTCTVLVTSRARLPTLAAQGAHVLPLEVLAPDEAHALLAGRLGEERLAEDLTATGAVLTHCAGLPLALAIVAARSSAGRDLPISVLADELDDSAARLDALDAGEVSSDLRTVLSWSYCLLAPEQARLLRMLVAAAVPDLGVDGIAALAGLSRANALRTVRRLTDAHLVQQLPPGRYGMHELVRLAAAEWTEHDESPDSTADAITRLLHWLLATSDAADRQLAPRRRHALDVPLVGFWGYDDALRWCESEHHLFPAVARLATTPDQLALAWQLPRALWSFYRLGSDWPGFLDIASVALNAAREIDDVDGVASALNSLGIAHSSLGDLERGASYIEQALKRYQSLGDRYAERSALNNLGDVWRRLGEFERSAECALATVQICRELSDPYGECVAVGNLGLARTAQGQDDEAMAAQREALGLAERIGDRDLEVEILTAIGDLHRTAGRTDDAIRTYHRAADCAAAVGARKPYAAALTGLAEAALAAGDHDMARAHAAEGQNVLAQLSGSDSDALTDRLTAVARDDAGQVRTSA